MTYGILATYRPMCIIIKNLNVEKYKLLSVERKFETEAGNDKKLNTKL